MKKFVYPAVFYYDNVTKLYCAAIKDLAIYIDGESVEEAHKIITQMLESFVKLSLKFGDELPSPTPFEEMVEKYPKNMVMLVECTVNE